MAKLPEINVANLDVQGIKNGLKEYLQTQDEFKDYDFEGSGLAVLLNLLAYNTHYMGVYANMSVNEAFLDSAQLRESVVSLAKHLNYTPTSVTSSKAVVTITASPKPEITDPENVEFIRKGTTFTTTVDDKSFVFSTNRAYSTLYENGKYIFNDVELFEGTVRVFQYEVETGQRYIIPDKTVDTNTLLVTVRDTIPSTDRIEYNLAENITEIDSDDKVYWIFENEFGQYELQFGDGVIGDGLANGQIVRLEYVISSGEDANGANDFLGKTLSTDNIKFDDITVISEASGGQSKEGINHIKFYAPKWYQAQDRAVTENDYTVLLKKEYPGIRTISVWGGEENDPPFWGKVFISIKFEDGTELSDFLKAEIENYIKRFSVMAITPEIVDPIETTIDLELDAQFDGTVTELLSSEIEAEIQLLITQYENENINLFEKDYRSTKLIDLLLENIEALETIDITYTLSNSLTLRVGEPENYTVWFNNPIVSGSVLSNNVNVDDGDLTISKTGTFVYYKDDGKGNLQIAETVNDVETILKNGAGTVDYNTGKIEIPKVTLHGAESGSNLTFTIDPVNSYAEVHRNQIFSFGDKTVNAREL